MKLEKYSLGVGDRFGFEGAAQVRALRKAEKSRVQIVPVWNKSYREHIIIGTSPDDTRREADEAVKSCGWMNSYYVDADHISLATVDKFLEASDFFTIDVADYIGKETDRTNIDSFVKEMGLHKGMLDIPGFATPVKVSEEFLVDVARKFLFAVKEAGKVYRYVVDKKGEDNFITEISLDETNIPQTPAELFLILAAIASEGIHLQTIAPKFSGSFLKGVDYVGDLQRFALEFEDDLAVVDHAVKTFNLPDNLKLSIHSGSDKFSLYPIIHRALEKTGAGLHLKTAGTTWLEEVIGLASAGGEGLNLAKEIYSEAIKRYDELAKPYLSVIHLERRELPDPLDVNSWSATAFVETLRHDQSNPRFNRQFRQLIHIAFRVAANMGDRFRGMLKECRAPIEDHVTSNLYDRHIRPLFIEHIADEVNHTNKIASSAGLA